jgi:ubiquinone/menaquinone biosynthesis C-methylase UbiE
MRPGAVAAVAVALSAVSAGCEWSGFGFRADGSEMPRLRQVLALEAGSVVADVGAGRGGLTVALADEVGSHGHVFSTDIDPGRVQALQEAVAAARLGNVTVIQASVGETALPPECCDAIVLRRVYHHLTDPSAINASLLRSLRPGGVLAVIDFPPPFLLPRGSFGVPAKAVISEVTRAGFELRRLIDDWPGRGPLETYCVVFVKP